MTADDPLAAALAAAGLAGVQPGRAAPSAPAPEPAPDEEPPAPPARWPDGAATGVGSMPGTDPREAAAVVAGELPVLTALPELPARGVGADMIGRTAGLLVDIAVEVRPSGYRVTAKPGRDQRRAVDLLRTDLDAFDEAIDPVRPPWVKVQAAGPVDARGVDRAAHRPQGAHRPRRRARVRREPRRGAPHARRRGGGAHRGHRAAAARRAVAARRAGRPRAHPVRLRHGPRGLGGGGRDVLRALVTAVGVPVVVHCCADRPPLDVLGAVGAVAIGVDATLPSVAGRTASPAALDAFGEVWDAGTPLLLGMVPARDPGGRPTSRALARTAFDLADRLGFDRVRLAHLAVPTPTCGLAGADPAWAQRALALCRELGEAFVDPPEDRD